MRVKLYHNGKAIATVRYLDNLSNSGPFEEMGIGKTKDGRFYLSIKTSIVTRAIAWQDPELSHFAQKYLAIVIREEAAKIWCERYNPFLLQELFGNDKELTRL